MYKKKKIHDVEKDTGTIFEVAELTEDFFFLYKIYFYLTIYRTWGFSN